MSKPDPIRWLEWGADALTRAAAEEKPILLSIGAPWCRWTAEMDRVSYRDPRVVRLVAEHFVPVRVDADRRPDVSERYTLAGWPTTAFLTPDGDILGGGTYLEAAPLAVVLQQVAEAFTARRAELRARVAEARTPVDAGLSRNQVATLDLDDTAGPWLDEQLKGCFDPTWAGFGTGPKRVEADALAAALLRCRDTTDPELTQVVTRTLDAIAGRGLWDSAEGGFFRYCAGRDWSEPQVEKVLTVNARLLELYLSASRLFDRADYADCAKAIVRFAHTTLADPDGGFFASQRADPTHSLSPPEDQWRSTGPSIDHTLYTDGTAVMASAYVLGESVLGDSSLLEFAAESVDRVVMASYERGGGVGHNATGTPAPRGLLTDQVMASTALLDLYDATGQAVYLDMPRELMAYCHRTMWDAAGGFADRARNLSGPDAPVGLLQKTYYPFGLNCRAAIVLARLGECTDEADYHDLARSTLARQTPVYRELGLDGAAYVLALRRLGVGDETGD